MNESRTTICRRCRESVVPERIEKGPNRRETLDIAFFGLMSWVSYCFVDTWQFRCPSCGHTWRPRLRDRSLLYRFLAAMIVAGAIMAMGTYMLAFLANPARTP